MEPGFIPGVGGAKLKTKEKKKLWKKKLTSISYSTKFYIQNKYFLNISYYKTHQQSITYKISVSYFVHNFCLVYIYIVVEGAWILFIYLFSCKSISKYFRGGETNIYIYI